MIEGLLNLGGSLIDKLFPDKNEAARLKLELLKQQQEGQLKDVEQKMSVMLAEAQSKDPWTSRARPSFMYVMYALILFSIPMGILAAFNPDMATSIAAGMKSWLSSLPEGLWVTFGVGYAGYTGFRTMEKNRIVGKKNNL